MTIEHIKNGIKKVSFSLLVASAVFGSQALSTSALLIRSESSLPASDSSAKYTNTYAPRGPSYFLYGRDSTIPYVLMIVVMLFVINFFAFKKQQDETTLRRTMLFVNIIAAALIFLVLGAVVATNSMNDMMIST